MGRLPKRVTRTTRNWMKRCAAIEPVIGHPKKDRCLNRNHLKGDAGNNANVLLAATGYNLAKLLAWSYCVLTRGVMVKKPPEGGSYSNTEHPVQNIILMIRYWINSKQGQISMTHLYGDSSGTTTQQGTFRVCKLNCVST